MEFNFKKIMYDLFNSVLASLIASLIFTFAQNFVENDLMINFESFVSSLKNNTFYLFWLGLFLLILALRFWIRKIIDKKQDPVDRFYIPREYRGLIKLDNYLGFSWEVPCDYEYKSSFVSGSEEISLEHLQKIDVGFVKGPFCPNDKREMKMSRTYWGLFKYKCPKCKYKRVMTLDETTLENEVKDEIESKVR